jgi:hypothetical protein
MSDRRRVEFGWAEIGCLMRRRYFCGRCDHGCYHLYSHWSGAFLCRWCAHQVNLKPAARRFAKIEQFMQKARHRVTASSDSGRSFSCAYSTAYEMVAWEMVSDRARDHAA